MFIDHFPSIRFNCNCTNRLTVFKHYTPVCNNNVMRKPYSISPMVSPKASSSLPLNLLFCDVCGEINIKQDDFESYLVYWVVVS